MSRSQHKAAVENLVYGVYSPAEFEKIKGFATTQVGRRFIDQRFLDAALKFQFRSRGQPPAEGAKVWGGRPPSEEAAAWNEIAKAANHLCKLLDSEASKWMPGFGDMTLANAFYDAFMEMSETGDLPRPLSDFPGGLAGFDPVSLKINELRTNVEILKRAALRLARDATEQIGHRGRARDLISLFIEDLFETFILLKTKVEPQLRAPGFSRGGPLNRFIDACMNPMRRRFPIIPPLTPDQLNARYREWGKRSGQILEVRSSLKI